MFLNIPEIEARVTRLGAIGDAFIREYTPMTYPNIVSKIDEFKICV